MGTVAMFRALRSVVMDRANLAGRAGLTFEGNRDLYKALGYKRELRPEDYRERFRRDSVAGRVVDAFPRGTWRGLGELIEDEDPKNITVFEEAWGALSQRLRIWPTLLRGDILAGLGRFSVVLMGAPGTFDQPLPERFASKDLLYLTPFSEIDVTIESYDTNVRSERFGMPAQYRIKRLSPSTTPNAPAGTLVHWSRVIHIADGLLDDNVFGQPRLERVWNRLDDLEKIVGAGSESFWLRAHQGYQFDIDKETELGTDGEKALDDEVDEFVNGIRRAVRTRGVNLKALGSDVANFERNVDSIISLISAGTSIPQRILTGSERGQLASSQDRVNWAERVHDRRMEYAGPLIVRPMVDLFIRVGVLPVPKQYDIRWPQIYDLSDDERATIAGKWADINNKAKKIVVTPNEIRDRILGLGPISKAEVKEASQLEVMPQPAAKSPGTPAESKTPAEPKSKDDKTTEE